MEKRGKREKPPAAGLANLLSSHRGATESVDRNPVLLTRMQLAAMLPCTFLTGLCLCVPAYIANVLYQEVPKSTRQQPRKSLQSLYLSKNVFIEILSKRLTQNSLNIVLKQNVVVQ